MNNNSALSVDFNGDCSILSYCYPNGLRLYKPDPFILLGIRQQYNSTVAPQVKSNTIRLATVLERSNYIAIVGTSSNDSFSDTAVVIWDDYQNSEYARIDFNSPVIKVVLLHFALIVQLSKHLLLYSFPYLALLRAHNTAYSETSVFANYSNQSELYFAFASPGNGAVKIAYYKLTQDQSQPYNGEDLRTGLELQKIIETPVHNCSIVVLALSKHLMVVADEKGVILSIYRVDTGALLKVVRCSIERVHVQSLAISPDQFWIAACLGTGILQLFFIGDIYMQTKKSLSYTNTSQSSNSQYMSNNEPNIRSAKVNKFEKIYKTSDITNDSYEDTFLNKSNNIFYKLGQISSDWAWCTFLIGEKHCTVSFSKKDKITIACNSGKFFILRIDQTSHSLVEEFSISAHDDYS